MDALRECLKAYCKAWHAVTERDAGEVVETPRARTKTQMGYAKVSYPDSLHAFVGLWRDAGGWTLRLGRTELNLDMKSR
jgi:hypothetical protein